MKKYIAIALAALSLSSCNDFIDRQPLDFGDEDAYFTSPNDFALSVNKFYEFLPLNNDLWGGLYSEDIVSDNQASSGYQNLFYEGDKKTVAKNVSQWNFEKLRGINFFINKAEESLANGHATGNEPDLNHYLGEGYFFRAYDMFRLLTNFGDAPILLEMQTDNRDELTESSKRYPRNEVARQILSDLDRAIELMYDKAP